MSLNQGPFLMFPASGFHLQIFVSAGRAVRTRRGVAETAAIPGMRVACIKNPPEIIRQDGPFGQELCSGTRSRFGNLPMETASRLTEVDQEAAPRKMSEMRGI